MTSPNGLYYSFESEATAPFSELESSHVLELCQIPIASMLLWLG